MKTCGKCKQSVALAFFGKNKSQADGLQKYCKSCQRAYGKAWRERNRGRAVQYATRWHANHHPELIAWYRALKDKPCADCKQRFPAVCMDFDHLPGFKKRAGVAALVNQGKSKKIILDEIAKCELVCANCHRIRTAARRKGAVA